MNRATISLLRPSRRLAQANFSTSSAAQLDLSNLYSKLTGWRKKQPAQAVVDPTQVKDSQRTDESMPTDSKPRKLKVIGKPRDIEEDWLAVREFAEFTAWPTNHYRKDLTSAEIDTALKTLQTTDFADLQARFDAVKQISADLKIAVPDAVFTTLKSVEDLRTHLLSASRPFDEKQPDAIYLNSEEFVGTNIIISDPVSERKAQKQKLHQLVKDAKQEQKRQADELMQSS